jgi:hypothetical protein
MKQYIALALRREVTQRANRCCEYCRMHQDNQFFSLEIDHIISEKHGGETISDNLCLACPDCNAYKGTDIASVDWQGGKNLSWLFNPRQQQWGGHFRYDPTSGYIHPLTPEGRVTVFILNLNHVERIEERKRLSDDDLYPC